jgi:hypothetical protein
LCNLPTYHQLGARQCSKTIIKLSDEFEKQFFAQDVMDALHVVSSQ